MNLKEFINSNTSSTLEEVAEDKELTLEIQQHLIRLGFLAHGQDDGILGPITAGAFGLFKKSKYLAEPNLLGKSSAELLVASTKESLELLSLDAAKYIFNNNSIRHGVYKDLLACLARFEINTFYRKIHFLSQCAHESGGLKWMLELASGDAYEGRKDLGNIYPGDGRRFKGASVIQITGRYNYTQFSKYIKDPLVLEKGAQYVADTYPFTASGFWWMNNKMNALCDTCPTVEQVSIRVNGKPPKGQEIRGLADRKQYFNRAWKALKD